MDLLLVLVCCFEGSKTQLKFVLAFFRDDTCCPFVTSAMAVVRLPTDVVPGENVQVSAGTHLPFTMTQKPL